MKVYVFTCVAVTDGVLFDYLPKVSKTRGEARKTLKTIRDEEIYPEYVNIRGYNVIEDETDKFTARGKGGDIVRLSVDGM